MVSQFSSMDAIAASLIKPVFATLRCLWAPIAKRINYARNLRKNWEELHDEAAELGTKRNDINRRIDHLKLQKIPTEECEVWIAKVADMENKIETIKQEVEGEKKCLRGLCPDIFARVELGERVVKMISDIKKLQEESKFEGGFLIDAPPVKVEEKPDPTLELTASSGRTLDMVLDKVGDKSTPMIGIWGMGGIGKTTVLHHLNNTPEITTMFDIVIWVTVSKSWNIRSLQVQIVRRLSSINITDKTDAEVASLLLQVLKDKRYLLLLDDVWEMVNLSGVGLPIASQDNGCKVVLTTRELEVCRKMETDTEIKMKVLSDEEAWGMFYSKVGDVAMSQSIKPLAEEIVRECGGLPLALKVVSGALRKVDNESVWRNFVRELKSPATSLIADMEKVFKLLKVSYDQIEDTGKRNCFLYCGLFPDDHEIKKSRLISYWRAEGLLSGGLSLAEARHQGEAILHSLIDSCLLERCEGDDKHVKLHDVVRDLVLAITSPKGEECKHLVRAGFSIEKMPEVEEWTKAKRISFMEYASGNGQRLRLSNLPDSPNCQMLSTLMLQRNFDLEAIPESFFNKMHTLRVLDLSYTSIESLPTSISNLDSLRELDLSCCRSLVELPEEVGALKGLEVLQVTEAQIKIMPSWISELTALKCLKLWIHKEFEIPSGVICKLSQMEKLEFTDLRDFGCEPSDENVVEELSSLTTLSSLGFKFRTVTSLQHFLQISQSWRSKRLEKFCFIVGQGDKVDKFLLPSHAFLNFKKSKRSLRYIGGGGGREGSILPWAIEEVLGHSDCFSLENDRKLITLSEVGVQKNTNEGLKQCYVWSCGAIENVIDSSGLEMDAFRNLEYLFLSGLSNLRQILCFEAERPQPTPPLSSINSFTNLRDLYMRKCHGIKKLFSSGFMIRQLSNLEELSIENCQGLDGMISEDEVTEYEALPKLKVVQLDRLPEFVSFFEGVPMSWPALEELEIDDCPKLRKLPFDLKNGAALKKIRCDQNWWDALEWDDNAVKLRLQPLVMKPRPTCGAST